jgi:endonuclease G
VIDLATGAAVGIHFAGRFLETNYAVPADVIAERLHVVEHGDNKPRPSQPLTTPTRSTHTVPLLLTLELEAPANTMGKVHVIAASVKIASQPIDAGEDNAMFAAEGRPEDYVGRAGYQPDFLGNGLRVPLPAMTRDKANVLRFPFAGDLRAVELKYTHFSVVMHQARRLCFFSAVNIDGGTSKRSKRAGWLLDPRIPKDAQIKGECYGNPPRFSRGHMTRREDPVWGDDEEAARANADSMHVTNSVPQMQAFNAPVWLGLEDYALEHARRDRMRLCVITGPVLKADDPVLFGVQIPRAFWKVIAFVHDTTGKLCATGYSISQEDFLKPDEFVFGAYETHQRPLHWIEQEAGVSFGALKKADHFKENESAGAGVLRRFEEIQFV